MTLSDFTKLIDYMRESMKWWQGLRKFGLDIIDEGFPISQAFYLLRDHVFNPVQIDTIDWWLYDAPKGVDGPPVNAKIYDSKTNEVLYNLNTVETLYEYLNALEEPV